MNTALKTVFALLLLCAASTGRVFADDPAEPSDYAKKVAREDAEKRKKEEAEEDEEAAKRIASATPINHTGPFRHLPESPGETVMSPLIPGRIPYNCLEWGFCRKTAWALPNKTITLEQMVAREGFDVSKPVDCNASKAEHVIMLVFHVPAGTCNVQPDKMPPSGFWTHVIKRLEGRFSSKNGSGPLYEDIKDVDEFLRKHYPAAPGKEICTRCYAKP